MANISFIGLGVMGFHMAGHLSNAGHDVTVYNRTKTKSEKWATQFKGQIKNTPKSAAENADIICICVGNDQDLIQVTCKKDGILEGAKSNALVIDHTTASADAARLLAKECAKKGTHFIDAPVSGGEQGAINGQLTVMCGGEKNSYIQAKNVIQHYAKSCELMGTHGAGQLTKMVNQICVAGVLQGLAEGMHFAEKADLDLQQVIDVVSKGAAGSWQMDNRHKTMIANKYDHGFALDWMRKDLTICSNEASTNGADISNTRTIAKLYDELSNQGHGRWDTSALLSRLQNKPS